MNQNQVLLIDDQQGLGGILQALFEADQIALTQAMTGAEGLERLGRVKFEAVILDLRLPDTDGGEVLRTIRGDLRRALLPVIILTGDDRMEEKIRLFGLGATDYIIKPYHPMELRARVTAVLRVATAGERARNVKVYDQALFCKNILPTRAVEEEVRNAVRCEHTRPCEHILRAVVAENEARNRADFIARISHEIRNPINGILATSEMVLESGLADQQRQMVQVIHQSSKSCLTLLNDILNFAKLESDKLEFEAKPFPPRACVETVLDLVAGKVGKKNLDLVALFAPGADETVEGDRERLYQVLLNLVSNAVKFTQQGEVVVEICRLQSWDDIPPGHRPNSVTKGGPPPAASSYLLVRVRDTGIGIPPEVLPSLFQAYVQANAHVQRKYGGTGLGLAISKKIIESLGGSIWVESVPAQGTTFSFCWPSRRVDGHSPAREPAVEAGRSANHRQATPGQAEKILIIENGTANRAYLQAEVQRMQFAPMAYANPQEALAWLARNQVRAAIIDDRVNDPDGVARQIRQISGNALLPLILLTPINAERSQLADIPPPSRRIYKPIKLEAIQQSLNQLIRQEPSVPTQPVPRPAPAVTPKLGESYPTQILLADDNPINLQVGLNLLRRIGCSADTASDGQEVLNTLSQKRYDILLLDIQMPLMDGFAVAQRIRQQEREAKQAGNGEPKFPLVIIAITANVMRGDSERMMAVGMNDYLAKPVDSRAFDTTLTRWIRHVHMARSMVNTRGVQPRAEEALHSMPGTTANGACAHPNTLERGADREPPVNLTQFRKIAGTSEAEVRSLRELFLDRTSDLMRQLKQALADGNTGEAKRLAHKGSGSSGTCGMPPLAGLLRDTERLSEAGQLADARLAFESAQCEFEQVREFLQKVI